MILFGRSDFSIGSSILQPDAIARAAADLKYEAVSLVDTMTISGAIDFCAECNDQKIKPLVGCRIKVVRDPSAREVKSANGEHHWDLYIRNADGYRDLCELLSIANQDDHFYYTGRVSIDELCTVVSRGNLLVATSDQGSVFHQRDCATLVQKVYDAASENRDSNNFFIRLIDEATPVYDRVNRMGIELSIKLSAPAFIGRTALYPDADHYDTRIVHSAIAGNSKLSSGALSRPFQRDQHFIERADAGGQAVINLRRRMSLCLEKAEFDALGIDFWRSLVTNHELLTAEVDWSWKKLPISLPKMAPDEDAALKDMTVRGFTERLSKDVMGYRPDAHQLADYKARAQYELEVLKKLGFAGYFLLVADLVNWSKASGILVGPGRGSVGGSLVAYLIGITDVDPIRFGLMFERFINPERLDLPDADLDFMSTRRDEVIRYLEAKYGTDRVAGISNYSYLGPSSAIRDVGRVYGLDFAQTEASKYVPKEHGKSVSLEEAAAREPRIKYFKDRHPEVWNDALRLDGTLRNLGRHAAGVIVSEVPIIERAVVERRSGERTINWDKRVSEDAGLVKLDVLGLSTLDVIRITLDMIEESAGERVDLLSIPLDDCETLAAFGRGETAGVFQFESSGMRSLLKSLAVTNPLTFDDLAATTALYRPGPMDSGLMDQYVQVRQGLMPVTYGHRNMESALKETLGVMIYQEQVMKISQDVSGFTGAEADKLRKIMGKKLPAEMAKQKDKFVDGAVGHSGMEKHQAGQLFDQIEKFAGYGFNKSHSVEYSIISYWQMWLKVKYPAQFYASALTLADVDKSKVIVKDAEKFGIVVMPPDVNKSTTRYELVQGEDGNMLLAAPLNSVKWVSENAAKAIIEERVVGPYTSIADFQSRLPGRLVNSRTVGNLRAVGAFAEIEAGEAPALDDSRIKDQVELMPGIINRGVRATKKIEKTTASKTSIAGLLAEVESCNACDLCEKKHVVPKHGQDAKFMVVFDSPNGFEEAAGKMLEGKAAQTLIDVMNKEGVQASEGYFTSLVRAPKNEGGLTPDQIGECGKYLMREIEALKPQVIVAMGSKSVRYLIPGISGGTDELTGTVHWDAKEKRSIVCGLNPGILYHKPEKKDQLHDVFRQVKDLVSKV